MVGQRNWTLLTKDKQMRYSFLERRALQRYKVREFVFASGDLSGQEMAEALVAAAAKMRSVIGSTRPPFVAAITKAGNVHVRWPKPSLK